MRIACWLPKATNTHTCFVITIAFPLLQWWHECASLLRYTYLQNLSGFLPVAYFRPFPQLRICGHSVSTHLDIFISISPTDMGIESHSCTVHFVKSLQILTNKCTYITFREFRRSLIKLLHVHYLVRFCKQGFVAAYHVV